MTDLVFLDTTYLSKIVFPKKNRELTAWVKAVTLSGRVVVIPEIADYEVRRGLLALGADGTKAVQRLDQVEATCRYEALSTEAMRLAAGFWAKLRRIGQRTGPEESLDADSILAAQAEVVRSRGYSVVVATDNVKHLERLTNARTWQEIG